MHPRIAAVQKRAGVLLSPFVAHSVIRKALALSNGCLVVIPAVPRISSSPYGTSRSTTPLPCLPGTVAPDGVGFDCSTNYRKLRRAAPPGYPFRLRKDLGFHLRQSLKKGENVDAVKELSIFLFALPDLRKGVLLHLPVLPPARAHHESLLRFRTYSWNPNLISLLDSSSHITKTPANAINNWYKSAKQLCYRLRRDQCRSFALMAGTE